MCSFPIPVFHESQWYMVSCGKCVECLQASSRMWSLRIMDEAKSYKQSCFVTLTYNKDKLPEGGNLSKIDLQKFIKRLRKYISPLKIRYFACGEYGAKGRRPHYHICIFGWFPDDAWFFRKSKRGENLFRSATLEKLWPFGFSSIGELNIDSAKYCAKYLQKFRFDEDDKKNLVHPFICMSNRPGIGANAANPHDLEVGVIYRDGKPFNIPRYYLKLFERDGYDVDSFVQRRSDRYAAIEKTKTFTFDINKNKQALDKLNRIC